MKNEVWETPMCLKILVQGVSAFAISIRRYESISAVRQSPSNEKELSKLRTLIIVS